MEGKNKMVYFLQECVEGKNKMVYFVFIFCRSV